MSEVTFGVNLTRSSDGLKPVYQSDLSTVGLVGTAPGANASIFPLDEPILFSSADPVFLAALGTTGTLPDALRGVNDQLGDYQIAANVVIVRVTEASSDAATIANIIGSEPAETGLFALLNSGSDNAKVPRLIGAPGFTHQTSSGVTLVTLANSGANYTTAPLVAFTGGGGTGATGVAVLGTGADAGKVTSVVVIQSGTGYTSTPTVTLSGGGGTGAVAIANFEQLANPVCAALPTVLSRLQAHAVVEGPGTNVIAIKAWRETINSQRLIPVDTWVRVQEGASVVTRPGASRVLGIGVRVDFQHDGVPMHSWANQPMQGIVGLVRNPAFSLTDGAVEGQRLLAANIGVAVKGELGVETAIAESGFIFIGTDNAGDDDEWRFYNVTRGRDFLELSLIRTIRSYLGRFNIEGHVIQAILNTTAIFLNNLQADNHILGSRVGFEEDKNSPENLRKGRFRYFFKAEEPPVLRRIDVDSQRYRPALEQLVEDLVAATAAV